MVRNPGPNPAPDSNRYHNPNPNSKDNNNQLALRASGAGETLGGGELRSSTPVSPDYLESQRARGMVSWGWGWGWGWG